MSDTKPREFWVVKWMLTSIYEIRKTKPSWDELQGGDEKIHVIEHSAYESLKRELDAVKSKLAHEHENTDAATEHFHGCVRTNSKLREELEAVKADFANTRFMFSKEQEWRVKTEAERDELKELVRMVVDSEAFEICAGEWNLSEEWLISARKFLKDKS